jgi:cell division protease FtsH
VTARVAWTGSANRVPSSQPPVDVPERIVIEPTTETKKPTRRKKAVSDDK